MRSNLREPCSECKSFSCLKKNCLPEVLDVKMTTAKRGSALVTKNVQQLRQFNDKSVQDVPYHTLLYVLADMCDLIAKGENWYVIIGCTKNRDAFSMTLVHDDERVSAYAEDFGGLCLKAKEFV